MRITNPLPVALRRRPSARAWIWLTVAVVAVAGALFYVDGHRVSAAPHAGDPKCGKVLSRLPDDIPGASRDWALGDGVASWGGQKAVFRCGAEELQPNINLCVTADGVDWVLDEGRLKSDGVSVLRTYGRSPAVEFTYHGSREEVGGLLTELNPAVQWLPQERKCIGLDEADNVL
ncbi:DUF3515 family protein [Streptomyces olivaceus]|uniref:DUF3515 family protein n=1 Tax=Streptomyces TaxID=1883 RepID=UPI001CCE1C21|nr:MULTISPECIES: DUF3515 family protein [Streptomyces]MBZ6136754.1 DUF3515 domain-containing protein [Streptomyces olivaceus]MBZ6164548.1 DUF3515 domain-containing protein [Streptomyces olivaceus]MCM8555274.1 DUF3515 domain-containing protein [Streptomyces sp. STCH 565 A]UOG77906.1 DUF3515 domain-containing protein [Streptomyces sp. CB09030]